MARSSRIAFAAVLACFFVSGVAGLVYEIVWARYLALFLGHTSYAVVAVLVAFMGGLALGNAWLGTWADRAREPLAFYGWLEIGVGAYGLIFPAYYSFCHEMFVTVAHRWQPGSGGMLGLKFGFSLLAILLPTVLMGGTLPVLTKFVTRSLSELREKVAALYCINSAGAVVGCIVADFWWIPAFGLRMSLFEAAGMNLLVGAVALLLNARMRSEAIAGDGSPPQEKTVEQFTPAELKLAVIGIGVSGFVAMLYEVAWTRLLALALGSSTHAFSLMLITFIAGIATGAWIIYRWRTLRRTLEAFAWAELALAATLFGSMFFYEYLPYWFVKLGNLLARRPEAYPLYEFLQAAICFGVMFVPTVCLGMTLPLVSRIATAELARTGRSVGRVFAVNTLGTVFGAALTGLWLMPWLGLARTFALGIAGNAAVGVVILGRTRWVRRPAFAMVTPLVALAFVWASGLWFERWPRAFTMGLWRSVQPPASMKEFREMADALTVKFYRDGAGATVNVNEYNEAAGSRHYKLIINGKVDASTLRDVSTQLLLGHVPMLLRPQSERALVIGFASGMTCGAVAAHPSVKQIDAVDILPEVVEASRLFEEYNGHVLDDPRLRVHVEDAKTYLLLASDLYDVIISEPSNPWMAGVAGVFSQEFYRSCRDRLRPDGLMVQWIHYYESNDQVLDTVLATFCSVFPYATIWESSPGDLLLVGAAQPWHVDLQALEDRLYDPKVAADLGRINLSSLTLFLTLEVASQNNTRFLPPAETRFHSDFRPVLDYIAQEAFFVRALADGWQMFDERSYPRPTTLLARQLQDHPPTLNNFRAFVKLYGSCGLPRTEIFSSILHRSEQDAPGSDEPLLAAAQLPESSSPTEQQLQRFARVRDALWVEAETNPVQLRLYCKCLLEDYRRQRSAFYLPPTTELEAVLRRLLDTDPRNRRIYQLELAALAWDRGDDKVCLEMGEAALGTEMHTDVDFSFDPGIAEEVIYRMAESNLRADKPEAALRICQLAAQAGYTGPRLEMISRKVIARVAGEPIANFP